MPPTAARTKRAHLNSPPPDDTLPQGKRRRSSQDTRPSPRFQAFALPPTPPSTTSADSAPLSSNNTSFPLENSRLPSPVQRTELPYDPEFGAKVCARFKINMRNERFHAKWRQEMRCQKYGSSVARSLEGLATPDDVVEAYQKRQRDAEAEMTRYLVEGSSDEEQENFRERASTGLCKNWATTRSMDLAKKHRQFAERAHFPRFDWAAASPYLISSNLNLNILANVT